MRAKSAVIKLVLPAPFPTISVPLEHIMIKIQDGGLQFVKLEDIEELVAPGVLLAPGRSKVRTTTFGKIKSQQ